MAKMMTKSATYAHLAQKTNLTKKQIAELFDETLALATKEAEERLRAAGLRQARPRQPQGADGTQPADGRAHQDPGQARVQVPPRQEPEGHGAWQEVASGAAAPRPRGALGPPLRARRRLRSAPRCVRSCRGSGRASATVPWRRRDGPAALRFRRGALARDRRASLLGVGRLRRPATASARRRGGRRAGGARRPAPRPVVVDAPRREPSGDRRAARRRRPRSRRGAGRRHPVRPAAGPRPRLGPLRLHSRAGGHAAGRAAGRAGAGLYAWRGGSALWSLRDVAAAS